MACELCETVSGKEELYLVTRITIGHGYYRFMCNCPESAGKYGPLGLRNAGFLWSDRCWGAPEGVSMIGICSHLFACLTIYETVRMRDKDIPWTTAWSDFTSVDWGSAYRDGVAEIPDGIESNSDWCRARDAAIGHGEKGGTLEYEKMHALFEANSRCINNMVFGFIHIRSAGASYSVELLDKKNGVVHVRDFIIGKNVSILVVCKNGWNVSRIVESLVLVWR